MSDSFFGGILDNIGSDVTDLGSFLSATMQTPGAGMDVTKGIAGGSTGGMSQGQKNYQRLAEANYLAKMNNVPMDHSAESAGYAPVRPENRQDEGHAVNYENIEQSWLMRMRRFSQIDSEQSVGKINEGPDR